MGKEKSPEQEDELKEGLHASKEYLSAIESAKKLANWMTDLKKNSPLTPEMCRRYTIESISKKIPCTQKLISRVDERKENEN